MQSRYHGRSAIIGAVAALIGVLVFAAAAPESVLRVLVLNPVEVRGIPSPDQLVRIDAGQQYVVPTDKVLVITGVANKNAVANSGLYQILVDGVQELSGNWGNLNNSGDSTVYFWGYKVDPDSVVEIQGSGHPWIILGYLADK